MRNDTWLERIAAPPSGASDACRMWFLPEMVQAGRPGRRLDGICSWRWHRHACVSQVCRVTCWVMNEHGLSDCLLRFMIFVLEPGVPLRGCRAGGTVSECGMFAEAGPKRIALPGRGCFELRVRAAWASETPLPLWGRDTLRLGADLRGTSAEL